MRDQLRQAPGYRPETFGRVLWRAKGELELLATREAVRPSMNSQ